MNPYPVFIQLRGLRCLVVGGGSVALRRVLGLLDAGALPHIIAPQVCPELKLKIIQYELDWVNRCFNEGDTAGFQLIIAATNNKEANTMIRREALQASALINDVSNPSKGNFHVPALVRRPPLMLAIGTSGEVPYLSHKLKVLFEKKLQPQLGSEIEKIKRCRASIIKRARADDKVKKQLILSELNPLIESFIRVFG